MIQAIEGEQEDERTQKALHSKKKLNVCSVHVSCTKCINSLVTFHEHVTFLYRGHITTRLLDNTMFAYLLYRELSESASINGPIIN